MPNFIDDFLEYSKEAESPTQYFKWAAITTLAAVMRDRCYYELGLYTLYPNLFTILLSSGSSHTRKSIPMRISKELLQAVDNTHIIDGRNSIQGIIRVLASAHTDKKGKITNKGACGLLYSDELSGYFHKDTDTWDIMMELYDSPRRWTKNLANEDHTRRLENVCLSLLGATNEENLSQVYDQRVAAGGMLARTILVRATGRRKQNSLEYQDENIKYDNRRLVAHLQRITTLKGPFFREPGAKKEFHDWYMSITDDKFSKSGIEARMHDTVRKIAMCCAVADEPELVIRRRHMAQAIDSFQHLLRNYRIAVGGLGISSIAKISRDIIGRLLEIEGHILTCPEIMRAHYGDITQETLDQFITTFTQSEMIETGKCLKTGQITIRLTEKTLDMYASKLKEKKG